MGHPPMGHEHVHEGASIVGLLAVGVVDAELGGLLWLLVEGGVPVVVTSGHAGSAARLASDGLRDLVPPAGGLVEVDLAEISTAADARALLGRVAAGGRLLATADDGSLADLFAHLSRIGLTDDEQTVLGAVLVLGADGRVDVAHYVRPLVRDAGGHVRRLGPAVLAIRDAGHGAFEHFAWGIVPELAERVGLTSAGFEVELGRRSALLGRLAEAGLRRPAEVRSELRAYRTGGSAAGR